MFGPCFVVQYLVSFLVLQSSRWRRDSWFIDFYCPLDVMLLLYCSLPLPHGAVG